MKIQKLFQTLINSEYSYEAAWELVFLYNFLKDEDRFNKILKIIKTNYDAKHINQFVKCITHNIDYTYFLLIDDLDVIIEGRRMQEDLYSLNMKLDDIKFSNVLKLNAQLIYELRRFLKDKNKISYFEKIVDLSLKYNIKHWQFISFIYDNIDNINIHEYFKVYSEKTDLENWLLLLFEKENL